MALPDLTKTEGQKIVKGWLSSVDNYKTERDQAIRDRVHRIERELTGPHGLYIPAVEHAEEMGVHIWGNLPWRLLHLTRPREEHEVRDYRLDSYQPVTRSFSDKALIILLKIFNSKLWSIIWKDTAKGQDLKDYLTKQFPILRDFMLYIQKVVMRNMLADPNGVIFYRPKNFFIDQNEVIDPVPIIYESWQILNFIEDEYFVLLDKETIGKKKQRTVWLVDNMRMQQWMETKNPEGAIQWVLLIDWEHDLQILPIWVLGGQVDGQHQGQLYKSFFESAASHWNKFINSESDLDGAFINHMHPIRVEVAEDCDFEQEGQRCHHGFILSKDQKTKHICNKCHGTGRQSVKSPFGVYMINKGKFEGDDAAGLTPVEFVTVPTEPTSLLSARRDKQSEEGFSALNMEIVNQIGENQSGVAKEIDRDGLSTTLQTISDHTFKTHVFNFIWFTSVYRNKTRSGKDILAFQEDAFENILPEINIPVQFDTMTIKELTKQLSEAKTAGLSTGFIQSEQLDLNNKQFSNMPVLLDRINAITRLNPHPEKSVEDISNMLESGLTSKENAAISLNIEFLVDKAIVENLEFIALPEDQQREKLRELAGSENLLTENNPQNQD